jgi:hypothetical protein
MKTHVSNYKELEVYRTYTWHAGNMFWGYICSVLRDVCDTLCWMLTYMEHVCHNNITAKAAGLVYFADCYVIVGPVVMHALWADTCICLGLITASPCMKGSITKGGVIACLDISRKLLTGIAQYISSVWKIYWKINSKDLFKAQR